MTLQDARQAGAEGIVTALHEVPSGELWPIAQIEARKRLIEAAGLHWTVVESLEVTERIKTRSPGWHDDVAKFKDSLRNLAACGIQVVAYNFMPVFSWVRTELHTPLAHGGTTTSFDAVAFAAFDLFMLQRPYAEADWGAQGCRAARACYDDLSEALRQRLQATILQGLPGGQRQMTIAELRVALAPYKDIDGTGLREQAGEFLRAVCPVAEELGIRLAFHPDDPPRSLLGLPRIVSTEENIRYLLAQAPEPANGVTFCTGALGVRPDNALLRMAEQFSHRIWFAHLRSTQRQTDGVVGEVESFAEAAHLEGDADLIGVMQILAAEQARRQRDGDLRPLPFRCDHGQELLYDSERAAAPGYPAVGRLRGLAELRGVLRTVERFGGAQWKQRG